MLALKNDILSGSFGAPIRLGILHGYRRGADYYRRNDWAGRIAVNGREVWDSPFSNASAHNFQMMAFLLGNALHNPGPPLQKLVDALNAVRNGTAPVCGVEADLPHITAVCMVQQQPVLPVRDSLRISYALKGTPYVRIDGIEALFEQCLTKWALPMELGKGLA